MILASVTVGETLSNDVKNEAKSTTMVFLLVPIYPLSALLIFLIQEHLLTSLYYLYVGAEKPWFLTIFADFLFTYLFIVSSSTSTQSPFVPSQDFFTPFPNVHSLASIFRHLEPLHYDIFRLIEGYSHSLLSFHSSPAGTLKASVFQVIGLLFL